MQVNATGVDLLSRYDSIRARRILLPAAELEKSQKVSATKKPEVQVSEVSFESGKDNYLISAYSKLNVNISFDDLTKSFAQIDQNADGVVTQQEINIQSKAWQEENARIKQEHTKIQTEDWKLAQTNEEKAALSSKATQLETLQRPLDDFNRAWKVIGEHSSTIASDQAGISLQDLDTIASKFGKEDKLTSLDFLASETPELYKAYMNKVQSGQVSLYTMNAHGVFDDLSQGDQNTINNFLSQGSNMAYSIQQVTANEAQASYAQLDVDQNRILTDSELQQQLLSFPRTHSVNFC